MTTANDEFRTSLVAAVQAELDRHASAVVRELEAVRRDAERDRAELMATFEDRLAGSGSLQDGGRERSRWLRRAPDERLDAIEQKLLDQVERVRADVLTTVEASVAEMRRRVFDPFTSEIRREVAVLTDRLSALDVRLAEFDGQAARMVTYVSETTARLDRRQDELEARVGDDTEARLSSLRSRLDQEAESAKSAREGMEARLIDVVGTIDELGARLVEAEATLRSDVVARLGDLEQSVTTTVAGSMEALNGLGERLDGVDVSVSALGDRLLAVDERFSGMDERFSGVDDRLTSVDEQLSDVDGRLVPITDRLGEHESRFGTIDDRLLETERRTRSVADSVATIDVEAIEAMKDKLSTAAGEAMLVRIEMERFEKTIGERSDQLAVRLTEVETTLQDTTLDVAASVQLDRLEEIERALAEIDPDQFVRKDGNPTDPTATAPPLNESVGGTEVGDPESLSLASAESILRSDEPRLPERAPVGGSDSSREGIDAIIAAAEAANEREV